MGFRNLDGWNDVKLSEYYCIVFLLKLVLKNGSNISVIKVVMNFNIVSCWMSWGVIMDVINIIFRVILLKNVCCII